MFLFLINLTGTFIDFSRLKIQEIVEFKILTFISIIFYNKV